MKIAILSMQRVINYGSVLQAYSLKEIIESITGEHVDFIDPILDNTLAVNMPVRDSDDYTKKDQYGMWLTRNFRKALDKLNYKNLTKKIVEFQENELGMSYDYDPHKEKYDLVVEGSDEVFKASDKIYLHMYGAIDNADTLITYAAACGSASIKGLSEQNLVILKEMMKKYKFISVRDSHTYDYVKNLYDGKMDRHLDPVLVGNLYKRKHKPVKLKNYMIVYAYGNRIRDRREIEAIKDYAKKNAPVLEKYKSVGSQLKLLYPDGRFPSEMVLDRQRQALYEEREKLYEEYRYLKKEYADLDKASQTIDDYLEDLRNEPEHKRKKGELE